MDHGAEQQLANTGVLSRAAESWTWRRSVVAGVLFAVLIKAVEYLFGHTEAVQLGLNFMWESAKAVLITGVLVLAIVVWSLAKKAERLSDLSTDLATRIESDISTAASAFFEGGGKRLIQGSIAADAIEAFSLGSPGSERRYRLLMDHLRWLSHQPRALDPVITYLIEKNINDTNDDLKAITNTDTPYLMSGVEQIELSRRALDAAAHQVHFVDVEPQHDIDTAWSRPFHGYLSEVCSNARVQVKRQTIVCQDEKTVRDSSARSAFLRKQIEYMISKKFQVFLISRASAPRAIKDMDWRFEVYDDATIRICQREVYEDDQQLDVTALNAKDGQLAAVLRHIQANAEEASQSAAA